MICRPPTRVALRDRWMVSYLDVVTILLVFFVAAAAKTLAPSPKAPPPAPPVASIIPAAAPQPPRDEIREKLEQAGIEVHRESRGLVASLPQAVLFATGDDRVAKEALPMIGLIAVVLRDVPNRVIVAGHADATPIHTARFKNNWELSVARGMRVLELLVQGYRLDEKRMSVSGDGSNRPAGSNDTPQGRAVNRRVELVILDEPPANPVAADPEASGKPLTNSSQTAD
jgi:chemotaxis protein MotB